MSSKPDNPHAFPCEYARYEQQFGMTLRDYFVGKVELPWNALLETYRLNKKVGCGEPTVKQLAEYAAELRGVFADAMLAERSKSDAD